MAEDDEMQTFRRNVVTNGDKIRAMTDEELAELYEEYADCRMCVYSPHSCKSECVDGYTKWLKQEVSEDADD